ncbi:MAG: hypothetical protein C5B60_02415 [Chloroflexi bacterium]|nr:MAG: hypothetical protein C5B60_02415 [Chloroflexota bacterium]
MANNFQIRRTLTAGNPPPTVGQTGALLEGELGIELAGAAPRLWVGVPVALDATGRRLVIDSSTIPGTGPGEGFLPLAGGTLGSATATNGQGLLTLRSASTPSAPQIGFAIDNVPISTTGWFAGMQYFGGVSSFRIYSSPEPGPGLYLDRNGAASWPGTFYVGDVAYTAGVLGLLQVQAADYAMLHFTLGNNIAQWYLGVQTGPFTRYLHFYSNDSGTPNGMWLDNNGDLTVGGDLDVLGVIDAGTW